MLGSLAPVLGYFSIQLGPAFTMIFKTQAGCLAAVEQSQAGLVHRDLALVPLVNTRSVTNNRKDCGSVQGHSQHEAKMKSLESVCSKGAEAVSVSVAHSESHHPAKSTQRAMPTTCSTESSRVPAVELVIREQW
uniref:Uncharacterized protein n=1 Tax=Molossus molossus TaxID=27622 RepID=A0A7J8IA37_MOLMO|nr:hypothetical protein HJG59_010642 [Molossus molossus]